ncbi:CerR family C-terminal domain-containing protein [bacterium]|nr:CerR family C-terminal domain-containing protein [bacterium]
MDLNTQSSDTREKVLDVACQFFSEKGYRETTIALICQEAQANIAAVNYHFGTKEKLYQLAWQHAHQQLLARFSPDGDVAPDRPAAQRLRGRIRAGLQRAMMGDAFEFGIMRNEMANPTGLLRQVIDDTISPLRKATQAILRELLGPQATDVDVELCEVCVVAPWLHITRHHLAEEHEGLAPVFREEMLDAMVDHFTAYALAGIRETRRRIERSSGKSRKRS